MTDPLQKDLDQTETKEWVDSIASVLKVHGPERAKFLIDQIVDHTRRQGAYLPLRSNTAYLNTISVNQEPGYPGDIAVEKRLLAYMRWNALAMVLNANKESSEYGGHIATYASAAVLYEVGFNHFWRAATKEKPGDSIYIQGHSSPGIYARAFMEGRLSEDQLSNFRHELSGNGLSSYPHPWLMPEFWQFPTVSMGLGPMMAIYQARFMRYLEHRELVPANDRKVWCFLGDGEMDEPESLGAINLPVREKLDNLVFVVNCNLQRLDGPVRGNGKIVQELEAIFRGAGWHVIKVLWGSQWDALLEQDHHGLLAQRMEECVDGEYQNFKSKGGAYTREHFFGKYPELKAMVNHLSDDDIYHLSRGGHDHQKVYAAYDAASKHQGQPTLILAKTVKGYGMGAAGEGQNITHQKKSMDLESLRAFRDRFDIPVTDDQLETVPFCKPEKGSVEYEYLHEKRLALKGFLPERKHLAKPLPEPGEKAFKNLLEGSGDRAISTTMVFVRLLSGLLKDKELGKHIVPIVPDEARTFGMEGLFRQVGIYSSVGQLYTPQDADQLMSYHEDVKGQILEEGINEGGSMCSWMAAGTAYANQNIGMIPFYIYYSMFGFQRIGDFAWAAGDMQAKGFLMGATAGRTTLAGEGLQHQDGHSHLLASTIPNCVSYDPAFGCELVVIVREGLKRMYVDQESVYYYITCMNENYPQPALINGSEEGILKGIYPYRAAATPETALNLIGSGTILNEVITAADELTSRWNVEVNIWSATSFSELRREALACERYNRLHPQEKPKRSYIEECFEGFSGPCVAATDYMKAVPDQIRAWLPEPFIVLGTDGFGRSDGRAALRKHFEVDAPSIVVAALSALAKKNAIEAKQVSAAIEHYHLATDLPDPSDTIINEVAVQQTVPNLGDFSEVEIIEIHVKEGDQVEKDDALITLETDKAAMEVPSTMAGKVTKVLVQIGDNVAEGSAIVELEASDEAANENGGTKETPAEKAGIAEITDGDEGAAAEPEDIVVEKTVSVPDLGDFNDVEVIEVHVQPGDTVSKDESLITLETDKAAMEVPSSFSGRVLEMFVQTGDKVSEGSAIASLRLSDAEVASADEGESDADHALADNAMEKVAQAEADKPVPSLDSKKSEPPTPPPAPSTAGVDTSSDAHAGPAARRLSRELGVSLNGIKATGNHGRITKDDIKQHVKALLESKGSAAGGAAVLPQVPVVDFAKYGPIEKVPLTRIQKISGKRLQASWINIPHVTQHDEADIEELERLRKALKPRMADQGVKLTPMAFFVRAAVLSLQAFPAFNASLDTDGKSLVHKKYYHIGFAADTDQGLVVPVIKNADQLNIKEIALELTRLSQLAREGKLPASDMQGASFTISSLGSIGGTFFTPIVNAPEVAILGISKSKMQPISLAGQWVPRLMLPLSLSYDHRAIDGASAVRFTRYFSGMLEGPKKLFKDS